MPEFDPRTPSIARVYDYLLGGKDNFAADREVGDRLVAAVRPALDLGAPTCLIMGFLLHFYHPAAARALVGRYVAALAPGSYLVISNVRGDGEVADRWFGTYSSGVAQGHNYPPAEFAALFDGLELVPPGVVDGHQWHPGWSDLPPVPSRDGQAISGVARVV